MTAHFVEVTEAEMRQVMGVVKFRQVKIPGTTELVFERVRPAGAGVRFTGPDELLVRVFTSVEPGAGGRGVGEDAIRVVVTWRGKPIWSATRTHRTQGWRDRMLARMRDAWFTKIAVCQKCGSPMVERENRQTEKRFLGCSDYPRCRSTMSIPENG